MEERIDEVVIEEGDEPPRAARHRNPRCVGAHAAHAARASTRIRGSMMA
jgi:hypothetical protein